MERRSLTRCYPDLMRGAMVVDVLQAMIKNLPASGEDAILLERDCEEMSFDVAFRAAAEVLGPPDQGGRAIALLSALNAGYGYARAGVWKIGPALGYICWRSGTSGRELIGGACREELLPTRFMNPVAMGGAEHVRRVGECLDLNTRIHARDWK